MTSHKFVVAIAALSLGIAAYASQANAALTITESVGGTPTAPNPNLVNFDNLPLGSAGGASNGVGVSFLGGAGAVTGITGTYTAPYLSNGQGVMFGNSAASGYDTTPYLTTGLGMVRLTFSTAQTYLGMLWGSLDPFNSLSFYNGATLVAHITGHDVVPVNQGDLGPNGTFYVNMLSSEAFTSVVAASGGWSFEFDDVAYGMGAGSSSAPVPEPWSIGLLALGLLGIGYTATRRSARTM